MDSSVSDPFFDSVVRVDRLQEKCDQATKEVIHQLMLLNQAVKMVDAILDAAQPRAPGAIRISWDHREIYPLSYPQPVEYYRCANGKWRYKKFGLQYLTLRQKTRGEFAANAEIVEETLKIFLSLVSQRKKLLKVLGNYRVAAKKNLEAHNAKNSHSFDKLLAFNIQLEGVRRSRKAFNSTRNEGRTSADKLALAMQPTWEDLDPPEIPAP